MKRNRGSLDRLLRVVVIAPALIVISFTLFGVGSVLGILALAIAGVMLTTSAVGICPTYTPFGISTRRPARPAGRTPVTVQH